MKYIIPSRDRSKEGIFGIYNASQGVTIIELLVVIGIVAILGAMSSAFIGSMIRDNNFDTTTDQVIGSIRKAQNFAMDGKDNEAWGVCLNGSIIRMYSGTCATPTYKNDYEVPANVNITGLNETIFSSQRGEPSSILSITVSTNNDSNVVTVNQAGGMEVN